MYTIRFVERIDDDHVLLSAGGLAFNAILCLIPIVLLSFYVLGIYLDSTSAAQTINHYIDTLRIIPFQREQIRTEIFNTVNEFVGTKSIAGIIGGIGLLWSASALFSSVRTVFNRIFHIVVLKNVIVSKLKDFIMLSLIGVVFIIATIFTYTISVAQNIGHEYLGSFADSYLVQGALSLVTSISITLVTCSMLFIFIPDKRLPVKAILLSSGIATVLWEIAKQAFSYYISHFWNIGRVYGPYSFLIATAVWIYYSSLTLIIAAEFGEMFIERKYMRNLFTTNKMKSISHVLHDLGILSQGTERE